MCAFQAFKKVVPSLLTLITFSQSQLNTSAFLIAYMLLYLSHATHVASSYPTKVTSGKEATWELLMAQLCLLSSTIVSPPRNGQCRCVLVGR